MFAYLLIGVELAVIYAVFWFVFLREPQSNDNKAKRQKNQLEADREFTAYGANHFASASPCYTDDQISKHSGCHSSTASEEPGRSHHKRSKAECSCSLVSSSKRRARHLRLAWVPADTLPPDSNAIERLCHYLGRKLIQISLKAP
ncbi:MAG: hypothetical protein C5B53_11340 [Candidatus Melainabacteria bacterium]|nr:MAG: hypothetical protein C5B53_11340 [Candidatus Melainabacteria bacterium]